MAQPSAWLRWLYLAKRRQQQDLLSKQLNIIGGKIMGKKVGRQFLPLPRIHSINPPTLSYDHYQEIVVCYFNLRLTAKYILF